MRELLKQNPLRTICTILYLVFVTVFLIYGFSPARANSDPITGRLTIPSIGLFSDVTPSYIEDRELYVPDFITSAYHSGEHKIFLMAHSTSAFSDLHLAQIGDLVFYNSTAYRITIKNLTLVPDIDMSAILADTPRDTLILMTCAGHKVNGKYDSRLILYAEAI